MALVSENYYNSDFLRTSTVVFILRIKCILRDESGLVDGVYFYQF